MFSYFGGRTVGKGTYWNLSSGERLDVNENAALPGAPGERYVKLPAGSVFICGPLAGFAFALVIPFLFLFITIMLLPRTVHASNSAAPGDEAQACLNCHATPGMTMTFKDMTSMDLHVDESHFRNTVHGFLTCTGCHSDVSLDTHPQAQYANKQQFLLHLAGACRTCHADGQIMANPLHQRAITRANAPPCSECHGSHAIRNVPARKEKLSSTQYCLTCHQQHLSTSINGESVSLTVSEEGLRGSVHSRHGCTDCHTSYTKTAHPTPEFSSARELAITASEACKRCHLDKAIQHNGSIHKAMLVQGNTKAPVCSDCHGAHRVGPHALAETLSGVPCKKCHQDIFAAYEGSVHGIARKDGKGQAPICSTCHFAHGVQPAMASRSPKDLCMTCHAQVAAKHEQWLPNTLAHFDAVACTACHVPAGFKRNIYLRVTDGSSGLMLSDTVMRALLGTGKAAVAGGKKITPDQLWSLYRNMNNGHTVAMTGMVNLNNQQNAHHLAPKMLAVRQCDYCHSANSAFFQSVSMAVAKPDGTEKLYTVDSAALGSVFAMLPLNQFYVIGGTRLRIMDYLGAAMILGGIAVPVVHGTFRVLTARLRRQRQRHSEGG